MARALTVDLASRLAAIALGHVTREYPNKLDHVLAGPTDLQNPRALHPIFYGSFDWHSCVHSYWLLMRIERIFPNLPESDRIRALADAHFTPDKAAAELAYLSRPESGGFERPYGWAWLLMLAAELSAHQSSQARRAWSTALGLLAEAFAERFRRFLPKLTYPIRTGTHSNTAFALRLAQHYADAVRDGDLAGAIAERAAAWYGRDENCQAWEPGGDDFLSPALVEAECMRGILSKPEFRRWLAAFLPDLERQEPATLFTPAEVSDRTDGKIVHLDGFNLSRAWCWRGISAALDENDPLRRLADEAAERHLSRSLPHIAGDYMGEHWLGSFALLALSA
jgi:hypothetical protein